MVQTSIYKKIYLVPYVLVRTGTYQDQDVLLINLFIKLLNFKRCFFVPTKLSRSTHTHALNKNTKASRTYVVSTYL
jgi:hypothetical protein